MLYEMANGAAIDTSRECTFEERNFLQKMIIFLHMRMDKEKFQARWRSEGNPVWKGPETLVSPTPAVRILLDMEKKL